MFGCYADFQKIKLLEEGKGLIFFFFKKPLMKARGFQGKKCYSVIDFLTFDTVH